MKRTIITATALIATMILAACNDSDIPDRQPHTGTALQAKHSATRTEFDGTTTTWSADDAMTVFIDDGNTTEAHTFRIEDPANGLFRNDEVTLDKSADYEFHAVWPACTTSATKDIRLNIGAAEQTQNGSSTEHIAALDPLAGRAAGKPSDVVIEMEHTATLLKMAVRNATGTNVGGIERVKITAPDGTAIAGEYSLDIETGAMRGADSETVNTIDLAVTGSGELPDGEEFYAWVAAAPFEMAAGEKLTFTVTDSDGNIYQMDKAFDSGTSFAAGKIMSTTLELSDRTRPEHITIDVDFTDPEVYPDGFPTDSNDGIKNGLYSFSGYKFHLSNPNGYHHSSNVGALVFDDISSSDIAKITIPTIKGYALTVMKIETPKNKQNQYSNVKISITTEDGGTLNVASGTDKKSPTVNLTFSYNIANDKDLYDIKIECTKDKITNTYYMSRITLIYTLL